MRRFLRVASQTLVTPVITAALYLFIFGATLGERISVLEGFSYAQFVIPGLILMGVINNAFSNAASSLFMSRYLGNIVDLLVTPLTPAQFIMAYTLAAMLRGLAVGVVVWLISLCFAAASLDPPAAGRGHGHAGQLPASPSSASLPRSTRIPSTPWRCTPTSSCCR